MRGVATLATCLALPASVAFAAERIEGQVTYVRDVDTIEVNNRPIHLNGVDGPEMDEQGGRVAKQWMQKLVLRKRVTCELNG